MRDSLISTFLTKNSQLNLSSLRDTEGVRIKHIMDSIEIQKIFPLQDWWTLCDVGTWGWFPLLPLAILYPRIQCVGIDARRKKIDAINDMIQELHISNAQVIRTRIQDFHQQFDVVTARAVSYSTTLIPQVLHLLKPGGYLILYKQTSEEEHADILFLCKKYDLHIAKEHHYHLFAGDIERILYVLHKK